MTGRLIVDDELGARSDAALGSNSIEPSRFGRALASPRDVLISVPVLVALVGVTLTLVGQQALAETSLSMARQRFGEQSSFAGHRIAQAARPVGCGALGSMDTVLSAGPIERPS